MDVPATGWKERRLTQSTIEGVPQSGSPEEREGLSTSLVNIRNIKLRQQVKVPINFFSRQKSPKSDTQPFESLLPAEDILQKLDNVEVYSSQKLDYSNKTKTDTDPDGYFGTLVLTPYRLIFRCESCPALSFALPLNFLKDYLIMDLKWVNLITYGFFSFGFVYKDPLAVLLKAAKSHPSEALCNVIPKTPLSDRKLGVPPSLKSSKEADAPLPLLPSRPFCPGEELKRVLQREDCGFTVLDINANFKVCPFYGANMIVPSRFIEDKDFLVEIASHRYQKRFPMFSWGISYPSSSAFTLLLRTKRSKLSRKSQPSQELTRFNDLDLFSYLWELINETEGDGENNNLIHVMDLGSKEEEMVQFYSSYCTFEFLEISNGTDKNQDIGVRIEKTLQAVLATKDLEDFNQVVYEIENSGWTQLLKQSLAISARVSELLTIKKASVLIQSPHQTEEGVDMDFVIVSLAQILSDPFYRTLKGFQVLLDKEWIYFGYPFAAFKHASNFTISPLFFFFINCVFEIMQHYFMEFEFNQHFLSFLLDSLFHQRFENFMWANEAHRETWKSKNKPIGPSIWTFIDSNQHTFKNSFYNPKSVLLSLQFNSYTHSIVFYEYIFQHNVRHEMAFYESKGKGPKDTEWTRKIDFRNYVILPDDFGLNRNLNTLSISGNNISSLPPSIGLLTNLKKLNVHTNQYLGHFPSILLTLTQLSELFMMGNNMSHLPSNISLLRNLVIFMANDNKITKIPNSFGKLIHLKTVNFSSNPLTKLPSSFQNLRNIKNLSLSKCKFKHMPSFIVENMVCLEELDISENELVAMPSVGKLTNLHFLRLNKNKLTEVDVAVGSMTHLDISFNKISSLSESIGFCTSLVFLNSSNNMIEIVPKLIGKCRNLRDLNLSSNRIIHIPMAIKACKSLQTLDLSHNRLEYISHAIGHLHSLHTFNVSYNSISALPPTLVHIRDNIKKLEVNDNPIKFPRPKILRLGTEAILNYLSEMLDNVSESYRIKIMVVGQEAVGKTSLIRQIVKKWEPLEKAKEHSFESSGDVLSTDGIDIDTYQFDYMDPRKNSSHSVIFKQKKKKVIASIWDFAGQEIYHTTHQFFLSSRTLYLLVFNLLQPSTQNRLEFWIPSILTRVSKPRVIIVGTHSDDPSLSPELTNEKLRTLKDLLSKKFPGLQVHASIAVSCYTGENLAYLREAIQTTICTQNHMGEKLPSAYVLLEQLLNEHSRDIENLPIIQKSQFFYYASLCGLTDSHVALNAAKFLHSNGSIFYIDNDPVLQNYFILNPNWLTRMFSTLFTTKHSWIKSGILRQESLSQIWKEYPAQIHHLLLLLMEKFEIVIQLNENHLKNLGLTPTPNAQTVKLEFKSRKERNNMLRMSTFLPQLQNDLRSERRSPNVSLDSLPLPNINHFTGLTEGIFLIPALLTSTNPPSISHIYDPNSPIKKEVTPITSYQRTFKYSFLPNGLFSRVLFRLFSFGGEVKEVWRTGIVLQSSDPEGTGTILVQIGPNSYLESSELFALVKHSDLKMCVSYFCKVMDIIVGVTSLWPCTQWKKFTTLPYEYYSNFEAENPIFFNNSESLETVEMIRNVEKIVPNFSEFLRSPSKVVPRVSVEELESIMMKGKTYFHFGAAAVQIAKVAPDISLRNFLGQRFKMDDLTIEGLVGEGAFSKVYKVSYNGQILAMKQIQSQSAIMDFSFLFWQIRKEMDIQFHLKHPNIVRLAGICLSPFSILSEYVSHGDAYDLIHSSLKISWKLRVKIALDVANALSFMHEKSIAHLDLKSPNILISSYDPSETCAKLTDFGTSDHINDSSVFPTVDNPVWLAPEIINKEILSVKADTYSYGVVLWELLCRDKYFSELTFMVDIVDQIRAGIRPTIPAHCPEIYKEVLTSCWHQIPWNRAEWPWVITKLNEILVDDPKMEEIFSAIDEEKLQLRAEKSKLVKEPVKLPELDGDGEDLMEGELVPPEVLPSSPLLTHETPRSPQLTHNTPPPLTRTFSVSHELVKWDALLSQNDPTTFENFLAYLGPAAPALWFYAKADQLRNLPKEFMSDSLERISSMYWPALAAIGIPCAFTMMKEDEITMESFERVVDVVVIYLKERFLQWQEGLSESANKKPKVTRMNFIWDKDKKRKTSKKKKTP